jgi:Sulfotransferase family
MYARPVARDRLGISEARKVKQISDYITRFRDAHRDTAEKFINITYRELVSNPMEFVRRIYERLDIPLTEAAAERMRQLARARSRYQKPVASPTLAYFGLDPAAERERFAGYCSRFGIHYQ